METGGTPKYNYKKRRLIMQIVIVQPSVQETRILLSSVVEFYLEVMEQLQPLFSRVLAK